MFNTAETAAATRLTSSGSAGPTEAYIAAILRGTTFLPRPEPVRVADRPAWLKAAAWPAAPGAR